MTKSEFNEKFKVEVEDCIYDYLFQRLGDKFDDVCEHISRDRMIDLLFKVYNFQLCLANAFLERYER